MKKLSEQVSELESRLVEAERAANRMGAENDRLCDDIYTAQRRISELEAQLAARSAA